MRANEYPYELINADTNEVVCRYKALAIACQDGAKKNNAYHGDGVSHRPYFVRRVANNSRIAV